MRVHGHARIANVCDEILAGVIAAGSTALKRQLCAQESISPTRNWVQDRDRTQNSLPSHARVVSIQFLSLSLLYRSLPLLLTHSLSLSPNVHSFRLQSVIYINPASIMVRNTFFLTLPIRRNLPSLRLHFSSRAGFLFRMMAIFVISKRPGDLHNPLRNT